MAKTLTVTATGDSLFVSKFPTYYNDQKKEITNFINSHQVKITNLETNLSDYGHFANEYSGGTWINTPKEYFKDLESLGFNFYGTANNHCMDYGYFGLLSTIEYLDSLKLAHAGTGKDMYQAQKPAILNVDGKKVAIFAVDTSFDSASKAGYPTNDFEGRPGVNYLRYNTTHTITKEQEKWLREIAKHTRLNFNKDFNIKTGYALPDKEGMFSFGNISFTTNENVPTTKCNEKDLDRIISLIKEAKKENDYVFMLVHCHDDDMTSHANPPVFLQEFCYACIDNGVSAIFGGGCHELRRVERYKGKLICYSLGDFIYQGPQVEKLPADFMLKYNLDINATTKEALDKRSENGKKGLHLCKENYLSILPHLEFNGDDLVDIKFLPIGLNFDKNDLTKGLPMIAKEDEQLEILNVLNNLRVNDKDKLQLKDGYIIFE